jgi:cell division protein FtsI (penicillin-binding protein 3)
VIDEPSTNVYGGLVAAPSFHNIAQEFLLHMDVAPDAPPLRQARQGGEPTRATISEESQGQDAPFVVGLSSREAILKLVSAGLRLEQVTVEGSGYVVAQTMRHEDPESPGNFVLTLAPVAPQP